MECVSLDIERKRKKKTKELFMDMDCNKPELSFKLNLTY